LLTKTDWAFCNLPYSEAVLLALYSAGMSERTPRFFHPEWDIPATPNALNLPESATAAAVSPLPDQAKPEAPDLDIPTIIQAFLTDAYPLPDENTLRITVGEASLTLHAKEQAVEYRKQAKEHTVFLRASAAGELVFSFTPHPPGETTPAQTSPPGEAPGTATPETADAAPALPHQRQQENPVPQSVPTPQAPASAIPEGTPQQEKKERVVIAGRVGRLPTITPLKKSGLIGKFPLAERNPDGTTTWHRITAFGKHAEALRGTLTRGELVTVSGYPHERTTINPKTGKAKTVTEIYFAGLTHQTKRK
jgi:hypothetical protein